MNVKPHNGKLCCLFRSCNDPLCIFLGTFSSYPKEHTESFSTSWSSKTTGLELSCGVMWYPQVHFPWAPPEDGKVQGCQGWCRSCIPAVWAFPPLLCCQLEKTRREGPVAASGTQATIGHSIWKHTNTYRTNQHGLRWWQLRRQELVYNDIWMIYHFIIYINICQYDWRSGRSWGSQGSWGTGDGSSHLRLFHILPHWWH